MYHLTQRSYEPTQLARLSLAKFSHTTTAVNHNGPLNWSHIFSNGEIYCHIDKISGGISSAQSQVLLRVLQNQNILEEVDLAHFAGEASGQNRSGQNGYSRPIFAVVVKLPCLAVKYPTSSGVVRGPPSSYENASLISKQVRRFQLKFSSDREFYTALAILSDIKCPFSESNVGATQLSRRPTSSHWSSTLAPPIPGIREQYTGNTGEAIYRALPSVPISAPASSITAGSSIPPSSSGTAQTAATDLDGMSHNNIEASLQRGTIQLHTPQTGAGTGAGSTNVASVSSTTPACSDIKTLDQLLPPKRELPFSKPTAKRARTTAQPPTLPQMHNLTNIPQSSYRVETAPPASQTPRKTSSNRKGTPNPGLGTLKRPATSAPRPSVNNQPPSQLLQPIASHPPPVPVSHPQQEDSQQPSCSIGAKDLTPTVENHIIQPHKLRPDDSLAADLSTYLSAPTHERTARLENWICQHIEDDGFIKLCQDVEGVWMRIAFGK